MAKTDETNLIKISMRLEPEVIAKLNKVRTSERRGTLSDTIRALIGEAFDARQGGRRKLVSSK